MHFKMKSSSIVCIFEQTTDLDSILNPATKAASVEHSWPLQCILKTDLVIPSQPWETSGNGKNPKHNKQQACNGKMHKYFLIYFLKRL